MEFSVKSGHPAKQRTACLVLGVLAGRKLSHAGELIDKASEGYLAKLLRRGDIEGEIGQSVLLHDVPNILAERILLIGCGKERDLDQTKYRKIIAKTVDRLNETGSMESVCYLPDLHVKSLNLHNKIRLAVETAMDTLYSFDQLKSSKNKIRRPLRKIIFHVSSRAELSDSDAAIAEGEAIAAGMNLAKDLCNLPGNICTPSYLADTAKSLSKTYNKINTEILDEPEMQELGMEALLSVSKGSNEPAKLICMNYQGGSKQQKPVVFVGKGITFDAGGISIKPSAAMDEMKYDMGGAASVLGTMKALAELKLPINVIGIVAASENLPSGSASKPGDIVTSMSGQTVEILNTDAEGRLVLCDALTYCKKYDPAVVIDIATLTGAMVISLGHHISGLMSNHDPLAHDLLNAGKTSGDWAWRLPMNDVYQEDLDSNFADMANIGSRSAGAITAACFLSRFTKKYRWAHLDIAGTAWRSGKQKGATGRPVPLLTQYLLDQYADMKK